MATNYQRGAAFERRVVEAFRARGWIAVRAAGSHGEADVWAAVWDTDAQEMRLVLVQCKARARMPSPAEREALMGTAADAGAAPLVALKDAKRHLELRRLRGVSSWDPWEIPDFSAAGDAPEPKIGP